MKNYALGFISGLLITVVLILANDREIPPHQTRDNISLDQNDRELSASPEVAAIKKALISRPNMIKTKGNEVKVTPSIDEIPTNILKSNELQGKDKILDMLDDFSNNELARIESILKHWNDETPEERFKSEGIDTNWSLNKQAELEYSYYEQSPLKDLGILESIKCKTQTCQVTVIVPVNFKLKPSHYMDWSYPAAVRIKYNQDDSDSKTLNIYLNRD